MTEEEIRAAASSAVTRIGEERKEFIKNYPEADREAITKMCEWLDDAANNDIEERAFRPCIIGKSYEY